MKNTGKRFSKIFYQNLHIVQYPKKLEIRVRLTSSITVLIASVSKDFLNSDQKFYALCFEGETVAGDKSLVLNRCLTIQIL
jgi:hypothetical protein